MPRGAITSATVRLSAADIVGRAVAEIFATKGFLKETPELVSVHEEYGSALFSMAGAPWRAVQRQGRRILH